MIPITHVSFTHEEEQAVVKVLRSGQLAQGETVAAFEKQFASYMGSGYAVAVANGTVALHIALLALGIGPGDEVITTPYSFIASTNAILYVGATPVFVDIGKDFHIDAGKIEEKITKRTKAILPVHLFGNVCDMDIIRDVARRHDLKIIEDACQAHGAIYKSKKAGSIGDIGCFSFYATKNMTTGEGGMIVTDDKDINDYAKMARSHGGRVRYYHDFLGYNMRMTEMQAALGLVQLAKLDRFNKIRREHAAYYNELLSDMPQLVTPVVAGCVQHVYHQYTIRVREQKEKNRQTLIHAFDGAGIGYGIYYPVPIHQQKELLVRGFRGNFPIAEQLSREALSLPVHPKITKKQIHFIAEFIEKAL
ncbi:DegT/DnrJ/EryC1/StrS family aminotransferase [Candidatus Gottesmanbacteria bacterium]|nr:DegT/DnrJ/EryC1/StrS family aminotransferase [Candidatus Gottesmanbacteria bacterium]